MTVGGVDYTSTDDSPVNATGTVTCGDGFAVGDGAPIGCAIGGTDPETSRPNFQLQWCVQSGCKLPPEILTVDGTNYHEIADGYVNYNTTVKDLFSGYIPRNGYATWNGLPEHFRRLRPWVARFRRTSSQ